MAFEFGVQPTKQEYNTGKTELERLYQTEVDIAQGEYESELTYYQAKKDMFWSEVEFAMSETFMPKGEVEATWEPPARMEQWTDVTLPRLKATADPTQSNWWLTPQYLEERLERWEAGGKAFAGPEDFIDWAFFYPVLSKLPLLDVTKPEKPGEVVREPFISYEAARRQGMARNLPVEQLTDDPKMREILQQEISELRSTDETRYTKLMQLEDIEERDLQSLVEFAEGTTAKGASAASDWLLAERSRGVPV